MMRIAGAVLCLVGIVVAVLGFVAPWTTSPTNASVRAGAAFYTQNERFVETPRIEFARTSGEPQVTISAVPRFVERAIVAFDVPVHACRQDRDLHVFALPLDPPRFAIAFFAQPPGRNRAVTCRVNAQAIQPAAPDPTLDALLAHTRLEYAAHPKLGTAAQREFPAWDKVLVLSPATVR